jgi:hypothetical protein
MWKFLKKNLEVSQEDERRFSRVALMCLLLETQAERRRRKMLIALRTLRPFALLAILLIFIFSQVCAAQTSKNCLELFEQCRIAKRLIGTGLPLSSTDYMSSGLCLGYINGLSNALSLTKEVVAYCVPVNITIYQLDLVFVSWAEHHPNKLHEPAGICLLAALIEAFPCRQR